MRNDPDEAWNPSPDEPRDRAERENWGEEDWEAFLARQDVLLAKYRELSETLGDHPLSDRIIEREMHGNLPEAILGSPCPNACEDCPARAHEPPDEEGLDGAPALPLAREYARALDRFLGTEAPGPPGDDEDRRLAAEAAAETLARLSDGHSLGYERGWLCGNIACCKRALAALSASLDALRALLRRRATPPAQGEALVRQGRELGDAIAERIEQLRLRVWWS